MGDLNIGFMGGCINNQIGMSRDDLYYTIISRNLSKAQVSHQISLAAYLSYDLLPQQVERFIIKKHPDIIYLYIRPFPLMPLHKPIVKYDTDAQAIAVARHPALFSRKLTWDPKLSRNLTSGNFQFVGRRSFGLRDINLLAGYALGLHWWASKYLKQQIGLVLEVCAQYGVKLKLISPPQSPESMLANMTCGRINKSLRTYCKEKQIDLLDIYAFPLDNFESDRIHYNKQGHQKLAELLYNDIYTTQVQPQI